MILTKPRKPKELHCRICSVQYPRPDNPYKKFTDSYDSRERLLLDEKYRAIYNLLSIASDYWCWHPGGHLSPSTLTEIYITPPPKPGGQLVQQINSQSRHHLNSHSQPPPHMHPNFQNPQSQRIINNDHHGYHTQRY